MIMLRSPRGWTGARQVDGHYLEGFWRAPQIPIPDIATNPAHLKLVEEWMRGYKPEQLFGGQGQLIPELKELAPKGRRRMSANPGRERRSTAQGPGYAQVPRFRLRRQGSRRDPRWERAHHGQV